jgi:pimeloyl-ACP methyl ester carboxylesterase
VAHFPQIRVPVLFLEGTRDPFCDLDLLRSYLPAIPGPVTLQVVEGADHALKVAGPGGSSVRQTVASLLPVILGWLETL